MRIQKLVLTIVMSALGTIAQAQEPNQIQCMTTGESLGHPTKVQVTITMTEKLGVTLTPTEIYARGQGERFFEGQSRLVSLDDQKAVVEFQLRVEGAEGAKIILSFKVSHQNDEIQLVGDGEANVIDDGVLGLKPHYELRDCTGALK